MLWWLCSVGWSLNITKILVLCNALTGFIKELFTFDWQISLNIFLGKRYKMIKSYRLPLEFQKQTNKWIDNMQKYGFSAFIHPILISKLMVEFLFIQKFFKFNFVYSFFLNVNDVLDSIKSDSLMKNLGSICHQKLI